MVGDTTIQTSIWKEIIGVLGLINLIVLQWSRSAFGERLAYFSQPVYISHSGGGWVSLL
jgi:hypothetical protein